MTALTTARSAAAGAPPQPGASLAAQRPTSQAPASPRRRLGLGALLVTALHLVALGVLGSVLFGVVIGLFAAGLGSVFALGIGLVILVGLVYVLFGVAWFENERVSSLYGLAPEPLYLQPQSRPGFSGWARSIARQSIDGRMWRAIASFSIAACFGLIIAALVQLSAWWVTAGSGGGGLISRSFGFVDDFDLDWLVHPAGAFLAALIAIAAALGLAWWHAAIATALLGAPTRSALAKAVQQKSAQREGAVRAAELERTRIERDLHDGVQPRLVSIGMTLGLAQQKIDSDPASAKALVEEAHTSTKAAITELRQLARGIHVSVLDDRGLDAALSALAARSHIPVHLDVRLDGRSEPLRVSAPSSTAANAYRDAEAAAYFSIAEALTNAAKHSRASECRVTVRLRNPDTTHAAIWARVEDDGIGGATVQPGGGLDGISNRVLAAGGTFMLDSPQGGPTALEVSVPCAS